MDIPPSPTSPPLSPSHRFATHIDDPPVAPPVPIFTVSGLISFLQSLPPETLVFSISPPSVSGESSRDLPVVSSSVHFFPDAWWSPSDGRFVEDFVALHSVIDKEQYDEDGICPYPPGGFLQTPVIVIRGDALSPDS